MSRVTDDLARHHVTGLIDEWSFAQYPCAVCDKRPATRTLLLARDDSPSGQVEYDVCGRCAREIRNELQETK